VRAVLAPPTLDHPPAAKIPGNTRPSCLSLYGRQQHVINLFVWPSPDSNALPAAASRRGYHVQHGAASGMTYWAISDLNESDLSHFAHLVATDLSGTAVQP